MWVMCMLSIHYYATVAMFVNTVQWESGWSVKSRDSFIGFGLEVGLMEVIAQMSLTEQSICLFSSYMLHCLLFRAGQVTCWVFFIAYFAALEPFEHSDGIQRPHKKMKLWAVKQKKQCQKTLKHYWYKNCNFGVIYCLSCMLGCKWII